MLEIRDLVKVYKPKKGVPVTAIDHVSLRFPQKGMVFLLGKSGSGKSTLLNLLGGLDRCDDGEILIKGVSSRNFRQEHFDSYRNTYLGFIFQEYNILEEFNVGANIALALELQGRKATDEEINRILEQVDLAGFGSRKPNELSGGQKQRVAIARALVKNPEIIMADEPTGALDSNTGRQVLDTLKKLSADKLVIVVSHDRDFAERYADRIIELGDGKVIDDREYSDTRAEDTETKPLQFTAQTVQIAPGYHLTEEDRLAINAWLEQRQGGSLAVAGESSVVRSSRPTDESVIPRQTGEGFRLIKSRLPMKNAVKIGGSSLGHKKFRLVMTILLSCVAFGLFGLADTFGSYDHITTCVNSLQDSAITYASFTKSKRFTSSDGEVYFSSGYPLRPEDVQTVVTETGLAAAGVYSPESWDGALKNQYDTTAQFTQTEYHIYAPSLIGAAEIDQALLDGMGFRVLAGTLPDGSKNEMAITSYVCRTFMIGGYRAPGGEGVFEKIKKPEDMVGKVLRINDQDWTVTAVVETGFDLDRYVPLTQAKEIETAADNLMNYALYSELSYAREYSLLQVALVGRGALTRLRELEPPVQSIRRAYISMQRETEDDWFFFSPDYAGRLSDVEADLIRWVGGTPHALADDEIIISRSALEDLGLTDEDPLDFIASLDKLELYRYLYEDPDNRGSWNVRIAGYLETGFGLEGFPEDGTEKDPEIVEVRDLYLERCILLSDAEAARLVADPEEIYTMAVAAMPADRAGITALVKYSYREDREVRYALANSVTYELDGLHEIFQMLSKVFLYVGIGFALFASLMLANFINISISYKKQEIGILRAIGARSSDVFRIFFSESAIIAGINFVLSATGTGLATAIINGVLRQRAHLLVTVLTFGIRQIVLLLVVSMAVAAIASFIPVQHIASKRPIDAIRNR